ncbi:MAG: hypothetical protein COB37_10140 [Kordiimonadales bacterium]|nr:MAG: hypothetical protein COB37_10140 [Kordiimonadales bacterium]
MMIIKKGIAACCLVLCSSFSSPLVSASESKVAHFEFANSCGAAVKGEFNRGVRLLHSFEYPETSKIFAAIIKQEPTCAMAYWGAAMSIWHPLWAPPKREHLEAGARLLKVAQGLEATAREKAYLGALSSFFSSSDARTNRPRARIYAGKMYGIHTEYGAGDVDATVFYALSLLGSADPLDKTYQNQHKSGALLKMVQQARPQHPGVLHYRIHSYDFPGLAHLALDDAKQYAAAATDSAHAQHMPSHIFTRLGMWDLSLASNHDSVKSAAQYTKRAHLKKHYDEGLHSMDYLMYAMLQTGRDAEARQLLDQLSEIGKNTPENFKAAFTYASSYARYTLERRDWKEASEITLSIADFPWEKFPWAESIHHFARGIGAARSGQLEQAKVELATIEALQKQLSETAPLYWRVEVQVQADVVASWILLLEGKTEAALKLAAAAAANEDRVDKHPVTPGEVMPARELYADMLTEVGHYPSALAQYQAVLKGSPNRLNALRGIVATAKAVGDKKMSDDFAAKILRQTKTTAE